MREEGKRSSWQKDKKYENTANKCAYCRSRIFCLLRTGMIRNPVVNINSLTRCLQLCFPPALFQRSANEVSMGRECGENVTKGKKAD